jgi:hypothetical protein
MGQQVAQLHDRYMMMMKISVTWKAILLWEGQYVRMSLLL